MSRWCVTSWKRARKLCAKPPKEGNVEKLWYAMGLLTQNDPIPGDPTGAKVRGAVRAVCGEVFRPELPFEFIDMRYQPTLSALQQIKAIFVNSYDLYLATYELAEINRVFCEDTRKKGKIDDLFDGYWKELDFKAVDPINDKELLTAVGAFILDGWLRNAFTQAGSDPKEFGFKLTPVQVNQLRLKLTPSGPADNYATAYFNFSWSRPVCPGVAGSFPARIHICA